MKRLAISLASAMLLLLVVAIPALAQTFYANIAVIPLVSSSMANIGVSINNTYLATYAYINASGNNTRVLQGGTEIPWLVVDNTTWFASPLTVGTGQSFDYTLGNSPNGTFSIITGQGGNITATDSPNLEGGANFTISQVGWVDTNNNTGKKLVEKSGAFETIVSPAVSGNITSVIYNGIITDNSTPTAWNVLSQSGLGSWNAPNLIDGSLATPASRAFETDTSGVGSWMTIDFGSNNATTLVGWQYYVDGVTIGIWDIQYSADNVTWGTAYIGLNIGGGAGWKSATWASVGQFRYWRSYKTNAAAIGSYVLELNTTSVRNTSVTATGVSVAEHTVTTTMGDTSSLLFTNGAGGVGQYVDLTASLAGINLGNQNMYAIETWINPVFTASSAVFSEGSTVSNTRRVLLWFNAATNNITFSHVDDAGTISTLSWTLPGANVWYHVVASRDAANVFNLYVNGVLRDSNLIQPLATTLDNAYIGRWVRLAGALYGWNGYIDDVRVYIGRGMGGAEALTNYNAGVGLIAPSNSANLTAYWALDEGAGTAIEDSWGINDGILTGAAWSTGLIRSQFSISIDGTKQRGYGATVPNNTSNLTFLRNNVMPYSSNISLSVNGTQQLWYQPNAIIIGTTLPDRSTDVTNNPGTISWGTSAGIATLSPLVPYPELSPDTEQPVQDIAPEVSLPMPYDPATGGSPTVPVNPISPLVNDFFAALWGVSINIAWMILAFITTIALFILSLKLFTGHAGVAGAIASVALGIFAQIGAVPSVLMYVAVIGFVLCAVAEWKGSR